MNLFHQAREYLNPLLKNSKFKESGVLTPEEFVAAGDFLVYKCPTWSWAAGLESKRREYLPADKQYLVTRNVPCLKRVKAMEYEAGEEESGDGWITTHVGEKRLSEEQITDIGGDAEEKSGDEGMPNMEDIPDIDDFGDGVDELEDLATLKISSSSTHPDQENDKILKTR